jgi:hypothetical protein
LSFHHVIVVRQNTVQLVTAGTVVRVTNLTLGSGGNGVTTLTDEERGAHVDAAGEEREEVHEGRRGGEEHVVHQRQAPAAEAEERGEKAHA